jgi:hypothetical protein
MNKDPSNPPGKEEKEPQFVPAKSTKPESKAICAIHHVTKEVYCTDCYTFFCCRCMVDHLREKHLLSIFRSIDDLKGDLTMKLQEKIKVIEESQQEISKIKTKLVKGAADFRDDKKLDALYREIELNLKTTINDKKKEKNELYSKMNKLARDLDTKECSHITKLNSVQEDSKKISAGQPETVIEWTEKLLSEGGRKKGGEAKDVSKPVEGKFEGKFEGKYEGEVKFETEDKKEAEVLKGKEAESKEVWDKKVQDILEEAEKVKNEEMKSTLEQIEMKVIHQFYEAHFKDEIVKSTKQLEDYKKQAVELDAEIEAKKAFAKEMEEHQAKLQNEIKAVEKQIEDGRSYLKKIDVEYYKQEDKKIKEKIEKLKEASETIKEGQAGIQAQFGPLLKDIKEGRESLARMKLEDFTNKAKEMADGVAARAKQVQKISEDQKEKTQELEGLIKDIAQGKSALANLDVEGYKAEGARLTASLNVLKEEAKKVLSAQNDKTKELEAVSEKIKDGRTALKNMNLKDFEDKAKEMREAVAGRKQRAEEIKTEQDKAMGDLRKLAKESEVEIKKLMEDCKKKADALKDRTGKLEANSGVVKAAQAQTEQELKAIAEGIAKTGKKALEEIKDRIKKAEDLKGEIEGKKRAADALKIDQAREIAKVTQIGEDVKGVFEAQKTDLKKCLQCGKAKCIACGLKCGCNNFYCKECVPGSIKYLFYSIDFTKCPNCQKNVCKACLGCEFCHKSCKDCVEKCSSCGKKGCKDGMCLIKCQLCEKKGCKDCFKNCRKCNKPTSPDDFQKCSACGKNTCIQCLPKCEVCGKRVCGDCNSTCPCTKVSCNTCLELCNICQKNTCKFCLIPKCTKCGLKYGRECSTTCTECKSPCCNKCIKKCEACQKNNCGCCKKECKEDKCKKLYCQKSNILCPLCMQPYCPSCSIDCNTCKKKFCVNCKINCEGCPKLYHKECIEECAKCKKKKCKACREECKFVGNIIFKQ